MSLEKLEFWSREVLTQTSSDEITEAARTVASDQIKFGSFLERND